MRDHRRHDLEVPADGGARQGAQLDGEDLRPGERQAKPPQPEERVALALGRQTGDRLVAARVQGPDDHRAARRPLQDLDVGPVLAGFVGQIRAAEQELGPGQTDAVRVPGIDRGKERRIVDIDQDRRPRSPSAVIAGRSRKRALTAALAACSARRRSQSPSVAGLGSRTRLTALGVQQRKRAVPHPLKVVAEADEEWRAAGSGEESDVAAGAASLDRGAAKAAPVDLQKARGGEVLGHVNGLLAFDCDRALRSRAQGVEHTVAQIRKVNHTGLDDLVACPVYGDFRIRCRAPRGIGAARRLAMRSKIGASRSSSSRSAI